MPETTLRADKITRPMQLLAAWLIGLILIDGAFLTAAANITNPSWASGVLVIAAVLNVPLFLFCLFLLQTKYRPEMLEDSYYQIYLEKRYSRETKKEELVEVAVQGTSRLSTENLPKYALPSPRKKRERKRIITDSDGDPTRVAINDLLDSYEPLRKDLIAAGIIPYETFGSTSDGAGRPSSFVVSIGDGVNIEMLQRVLRLALKHGLQGIALTSESISDNRLYVGAYSYDEGENPFAHINEQLTASLLDPNLNWSKLRSILPSD